jgi:hypothetical protein
VAATSSGLKDAAIQLGEQRDVFRSIDTLLFLGAAGAVFLAVASIGISIALLVFFVQGRIGFDVIVVGHTPLAVLFGWYTARECWSRVGSRVVLFEHGFVFQDRFGCHVFHWDRIVRVIHDDGSAVPGRSGFPQVRRATAFTVFRDDGTFTFSLYTVRRHLKLARAIFDATRPLGVGW